MSKGPERILLHNFGPRTLYYQGVEVRPGTTINALRAEAEAVGFEPPIKKGAGPLWFTEVMIWVLFVLACLVLGVGIWAGVMMVLLA